MYKIAITFDIVTIGFEKNICIYKLHVLFGASTNIGIFAPRTQNVVKLLVIIKNGGFYKSSENKSKMMNFITKKFLFVLFTIQYFGYNYFRIKYEIR